MIVYHNQNKNIEYKKLSNTLRSLWFCPETETTTIGNKAIDSSSCEVAIANESVASSSIVITTSNELIDSLLNVITRLNESVDSLTKLIIRSNESVASLPIVITTSNESLALFPIVRRVACESNKGFWYEGITLLKSKHPINIILITIYTLNNHIALIGLLAI